MNPIYPRPNFGDLPLLEALNAIPGRCAPPSDGALLRAQAEVISTTLDPLFEELLRSEADAIRTDREWVRGEGIYLCVIIGGYRKLLRLVASAAGLIESDPGAAWHVLAAAGDCARQLVGVIASPEVTDAANRAAPSHSTLTDLHCAAAMFGFTVPLPDPDLGRALPTARAHRPPLGATEAMSAALAAIATGLRAEGFSLPAGDLFPSIASAGPGPNPDGTPGFQGHLGATLLRACSVAAFQEIDRICLSDEWARHADAIAAATTETAPD